MVESAIASTNCLTETLKDKFRHLQELIGNTPMSCIHYKFKEGDVLTPSFSFFSDKIILRSS